MRPSESAIDAALLHIFRNDHVYAGGRLSLNSLEQDWEGSHLRRDDLYEGLDRLERAGLIRIHALDVGLFAELTEDGERRASQLPSPPLALLESLRSALQLSVVERRKPTPSGMAFNRRVDDAHAVHVL